jgi:hypothetical protein
MKLRNTSRITEQPISYLTADTLLLNFKDEPVNVIHGDIHYLMSETRGIQEERVWEKCTEILLQQLSCCINHTVAATAIYKGLIQLHYAFNP